MPTPRRHWFDPWALLLPICLAPAVTLGVYAFGPGPTALRPVFFLFVGPTASLAVAELRRPGVSLIPVGVAVVWLAHTGPIPARATLHIDPIAHGATVTVRTGPDDSDAIRYFADTAGIIHLLPSWCDDTRRFLERFPTVADRSPFVIGPQRSGDWGFRPAGRATVVARPDLTCEGSHEPACETFAIWPERDGRMLGRCGYCGRIVWVNADRFECIEHEAALR